MYKPYLTIGLSIRKLNRKVNGPRKVKHGDPRCKCDFTVGQIIQHKKRPTIKYMLVKEPERVSVYRGWRTGRTTGWKLRLFSLRAGRLGGRIRTRVITHETLKNYIMVSDVDLPGGEVPGSSPESTVISS